MTDTEPKTSDRKFKIFISACEPSADIHCANLIRALRKKSFNPTTGSNFEVEFVGIGGDNMRQAGCELIENPINRASMIYNAFAHISYFYKLIKRVRQYFRENTFDLVIVCDSPAFNFHIAKAAKKNKFSTMFYVAPQLWAWAAWRVKKLQKWCDKLACILPFELDWFSRRNVETVFVGNPLFDDLDFNLQESYKNYKDYDVRNARIALFPGSREAEVKKLYPAMQKIAVRLRNRWPGIKFSVSALDEEKLQMLKEMQIPEFKCEYTISKVAQTARSNHLALVASGSATLQVASAGCPMIIMYQSNRFLWHLVGKWLIKTRFLSLVNILANREIVAEFMPYFTSINPVVEQCYRLLGNKTRMINTSHELVSLIEPMAKFNASDQTADIVINMITNQK